MQARLLPGFCFMIASVSRCQEHCAWVTVRDHSWSSRSNGLGQPSVHLAVPWAVGGSSRSVASGVPSVRPAAPSSSRPAQIILQCRICVAPGSSRNAELLPPLDHLAVPNLGCPVPDAALRSLRGERKQKNGSDCNFFAIADCSASPDRGLHRKSAGNRLFSSLFPL